MMRTPRQECQATEARRALGSRRRQGMTRSYRTSLASCGASCALAVLASVGGLCDVSPGPRLELCAQPPGPRPVLRGGELRSAVGDLLGRHA